MIKYKDKIENINELYNLIEKDDVIVVGVSGGPDSITLLTCLNKYKDKLGIKIDFDEKINYSPEYYPQN